MPGQKRKYVKAKRPQGAAKRQRKPGLSGVSVPHALALSRSLVPKTLKRTFNYCAKINMDPGAGTAAAHYFAATSLYDPDTSGVGHQPLGFDQYLGVLYDHYVVIGARISVTFMSEATTGASSNMVCAITNVDTTSGSHGITEMIEQGRTNFGFLGPSNSGNSTLTLFQDMNPAQFLGRANPLSDPDLKGSASASPSENAFFKITAESINGDDPSAVNALVTVQYTAVLIEPKTLSES